MSTQPGPSYRYRQWVLILYWIGMFGLTHWPDIDRYAPHWRFRYADKVAHLCLYAGWSVLWWWILSAGKRRVSSAGVNWLILGGAVYAIFDELTQAITGRMPEVTDFVVDAVAIIGILSILQYWQNWRLGAPPETIKGSSPSDRRGPRQRGK